VRTNEFHLTSSPGSRHGAVCSSAAGKHLEISAQYRLPFDRNSITPNHQVGVVAADDNDPQTLIIT
jgi:uncharacterized lipoprotein YbaY